MSEIFSGNTITIENLGNSKAKLNKISGSWQKTRSGINKFDISKAKRTSGVCSLQNNGDSINVIATNTEQYTSANIDITDLFKEGETIYAKADFVASSSNTGAYRVQWAEDTGLTKGDIILMSYASGSVKSGVVPTKPEGATKLLLYLYGNVTGTVAVGDTVTYSKIMLSNKPITEYEEYGAMPSPEFPSPIKNVTGSAKITVCNKNLLKVLKWTNGIYVYAKLPKINTRYFLSVRLKEGKTIPSDLYFGFTRDGDYNPTGGVTKWIIENGKYSSYSLTSLNNTKYISTIRDNGTDLGYISVFPVKYVLGDYFDIQLEEVNPNEPTDYILPQSQQFTFPLSEGQRMYKDSYLADDGVHHKRGRYIFTGEEVVTPYAEGPYTFLIYVASNYYYNSTQNTIICNHLQSTTLDYIYTKRKTSGYNLIAQKNDGYVVMINDLITIEEIKSYLAEQYANGTPVIVEYELAKPIIEPYTAEQENVYMQLQNMELYEGINHIFIEDEPYAEISVTVTKLIEDYEAYISSNGRLIVPGSNINYLVDLSESDIPTMPEAVESSVRAAGRDGDLPLKTTYEPMAYSIVCYTEDNLSLLEKVEEEKKINRLLNSIKEKTMTFALEKSSKFYNVKYSGALTTINYPKHLKFSIPLKSSESYGKDLIKKSMVGNSIGESNTAKEVGAIFILRGPATNPIISLNDYSMEYNMTILEGCRVEINSSKSTVTHINSEGTKTNVMKYYNHQFPKIENGINELKVLDGFESDMQVSVIWNDLKL